MEIKDITIEEYDEFYQWYKETYLSSPEYMLLGSQMQTITFTTELSKFVERKIK
jgi:hypothetical protein